MRLIILITAILISNLSLAQNYYVYVTAESEDEVALIKFDGKTATADKTIRVGYKSVEIEGPHGITVAPDGEHWYLSMAHGNPNGLIYKFKTGTDEVVATTELGLFPASMQISELTGFLFCVNFNLHGEMVPSTVSVVEPNTMQEITKIPVGTMPHGSRISPDGKFQYSVGMMSGDLVEINTMSLEVSRVLALDEMEMDHSKMNHGEMHHDEMDHSKMNHSNMDHGAMKHSKTKPTWVQPHPTNGNIYVAGNGTDEILEISSSEWKVLRRWSTGKKPYNLDITPDGKKLIVSYKGEGATGIWDIKKGVELKKISNSRLVSHGVAISPDSKYAFISVEGKGGEPGSVDVIDLKQLENVASVNIGKQAGGIAFWKMD